jgi:hypothetical protein
MVDRAAPERFERVGGAFGVERGAPLGLHRVALRRGGVLLAQVLLQAAMQPLQVGEQPFRVHHCCVPFPRVRGTMACVSGGCAGRYLCANAVAGGAFGHVEFV